jgi:hypothetical protein
MSKPLMLIQCVPQEISLGTDTTEELLLIIVPADVGLEEPFNLEGLGALGAEEERRNSSVVSGPMIFETCFSLEARSTVLAGKVDDSFLVLEEMVMPKSTNRSERSAANGTSHFFWFRLGFFRRFRTDKGIMES